MATPRLGLVVEDKPTELSCTWWLKISMFADIITMHGEIRRRKSLMHDQKLEHSLESCSFVSVIHPCCWLAIQEFLKFQRQQPACDSMIIILLKDSYVSAHFKTAILTSPKPCASMDLFKQVYLSRNSISGRNS